MTELTKNERITLVDLKENGFNKDCSHLGITYYQYISACKSLESKGLAQTAPVEGGDICCAKLLPNGMALYDDLKDEQRHRLKQILKEKDITIDQYELLKYAEKNGHTDNIFCVSTNLYHAKITNELFAKGYIERFENTARITRFGTQLIEDIRDEMNYQPVKKGEIEATLSSSQVDDFESLEFLILDTLRKNGGEIDSNNAKKRNVKEIFEYEELTYYTKTEITEASRRLHKKGLIDYQEFKGVAYWHKILDGGVVALRNNKSKNSDINESLIESFYKFFYGNQFRDRVIEYLNKIKNIQSNPEIVKITAEYVNIRYISEQLCHRDLWRLLHDNGLYAAGESNWNSQLKNYLI